MMGHNHMRNKQNYLSVMFILSGTLSCLCSRLPYFFGYKTEFFPSKQSKSSRAVL